MTDTETHRPPRRAAIVFIFITVVLDMLALGMIIPVLPQLVTHFLGGDTARGAEIYGLFVTTFAFVQFMASPVLGALSDRFGRRAVILLSNFGLGLDYILMAVAPTIGWLFAGRVIAGITSASIPAASAYIADVTPKEKRAAAFGMLGAAFGIGFIFGPAVGGLLGAVDPRLPFKAAAGLSLANAMYGLFVLPESLPRDRRAAFSWRRASPVGALSLLRSNPGLSGLAGVITISYLAHEVLPATFVLYAGYRYGWGAGTVGLTLAAVGVCSSIVQGGLVGPVVRRFGERRALMTGLLFGATGFAIYGLAPSGPLFWIGVPIMALWGLTAPAAQGLMTQRVGPTEQGRLQGTLHSLRGMMGMVGPGLFTLTFAAFIRSPEGFHLPGAAFLLAAALLMGALGLAARVARNETDPPPAL